MHSRSQSFDPLGQRLVSVWGPDADQKHWSSGNENVVNGKHHLSATGQGMPVVMCLDF